MRRRLSSLVVVAILTAYASESAAQTGVYIQMDMGATLAPQLKVDGSDNDWSTKCDLIINPLGLETGGECDTVPPRTSWTNEFEGAAGTSAEFGLGYDWGSIRLEGEYLNRTTAYDTQSDLGILDDVTLDKREQEIETAVGMVDDLRSHTVFANLYYNFGSSSAWNGQRLTTARSGSVTTIRSESRPLWTRRCAPRLPARRRSATPG